MKTKPKHLLTWGIEEMGETLYVGPLRPNSTKLYEIAYSDDMTDYTDRAKDEHRETAELIVRAVNEYNTARFR